MKKREFRIDGSVERSETGRTTEALSVEVHPRAWKTDRPIGRAVVNEEGSFAIEFDESDLREKVRGQAPLEELPEVYFKLYDGDRLVKSTKNTLVTSLEPGEVEVTVDIDDALGGQLEKERAEFRSLLLSNPNYFGTFPELDLEPVEPMSGNTSYEELTCLGLHPQQDRLQAVVDIKRPFGYRTDHCGPGSTEHVRFFVERGDGWEDLGTAALRAFNVPDGSHPLSYTVSVPLDEPEQYCGSENLLNVRAILSWDREPDAGDETWLPVWGNVLDATVQIDAWQLPTVPLGELVDEGLVQFDESLASQLQLDAPLPARPLQELSFGELKNLYQETDVPSHRFGFSEARKVMEGPITSDVVASAFTGSQLDGEQLELVPGQEFGELFDNLVETVGDTSYEELLCAGYNPYTREVGGVVSIKRGAGYSGGLCTEGSTEFVGFWVEHAGAWHSLGVAEVQVHDLAGAGDGETVEYAVFRTTNAVPEFTCDDITGLRLRAILSWNTPPTGPAFTPTWGNVVETSIQSAEEDELLVPGELNRLRLMGINRASIEAIDDTTGRMTDTDPVPLNCGGVDRPFGGAVVIEGDFVEKLDVFDDSSGDVLPGEKPLLYQVFWHEDGSPGAPNQLTNSFGITVFPEDAGLPLRKTQEVTTVGGEDYYTYMESGTQAVNPRVLAVWPAGGLENGLYTLEVKGFAWNGSAYVETNSVTQRIYIYNGFPHEEAVRQPDGSVAMVPRQRPELEFTMTGGECADIDVGDTVNGTFEVRDHFFGGASIRMVPITVDGVTHRNSVSPSNPGTVVAHPGVDPSVQTVSGEWEMDTSGLPECGYTIELVAWDRALVGGRCSGHRNRIGLGFCLREPESS